MVVSTDQWRAEIGSFNCHRLRLSKFKWNNNPMFLKIVLIYFLLMCKLLNTKFCLSKLATRLMFHWKAFFIFFFIVYLFCTASSWRYRIKPVEIFCTTNLITLLFVKKLNLFNTKQLLQLLVQLKVPHKKNF